MAIRVHPETGELVFDTLAGALAASRRIRARAHRSAASASGEKMSGDPASVKAQPASVATLAPFLGKLQNRPRKYLELLVGEPKGLLDSELQPLLGLASRRNIGGVITSLINAFKRAPHAFAKVVLREVHFNGNGRDHLNVIRSEFFEDVKRGIIQRR